MRKETQPGTTGIKTELNAKPREYTRHEKLELKKFSFAYVLLGIFPLALLLTIAMVLAIKLDALTIQQALLAMLAFVSLIYIALPKMARKVQEGIMASAELAKLKKAGV
ncbi:MAG: hypothetical protein NUV67_02095 [archaeon]|nr:hypothetical protein [archaeon]